jgi:hypothetical protein
MPAQSQFYFAWVDPSTAFDPVAHAREDELIFSFDLQHDEGQFCELTLEIANPGVGLLAPDRKLWAWWSWSDGTTVTPLFFGRLLAIPDDLFAEIIKIKLVAKPADYAARQIALAHTLKVLPYYDPIFIDAKKDKEDDPNSVLEGYSALWHVDRCTGLVTISDIITGEDGVVDFTADDVFYDSVKARLAGTPLLMCEIEASVQWTQCGSGDVNTNTVPGLVGETNPAPGVTFTGGVTSPANNFAWAKDPPQYTETEESKNQSPGPHADGDLMEEKSSITVPMYFGEIVSHNESITNADPSTGQGAEYSINESYKSTDKYWSVPAAPTPGDPTGSPPPDVPNPNTQPLAIAAEVSQNRVEDVYVALRADVQPVLASLTLDQKDLTESLTINSRDLVVVGVLNTHSSAYLATPRGQQSIEYLLHIARAHLLARARIFNTEWECPFPKIVASNLSCRKNATIADERLPGTTVVGKIVSYGISGDGDSGVFVGKVNIQSAVGNYVDATGATTAPGTPDYVEDIYVDPAYQHHTDALTAAATDDMSFAPVPFVPTGIQFPLTLDQILISHEYNDAGTVDGRAAINDVLVSQSAALSNLPPTPNTDVRTPITSPPADMIQRATLSAQMNVDLANAIFDNQSWVSMEFAPLQNVLLHSRNEIQTTPLRVLKQIDLAA